MGAEEGVEVGVEEDEEEEDEENRFALPVAICRSRDFNGLTPEVTRFQSSFPVFLSSPPVTNVLPHLQQIPDYAPIMPQ